MPKDIALWSYAPGRRKGVRGESPSPECEGNDGSRLAGFARHEEAVAGVARRAGQGIAVLTPLIPIVCRVS
jgi:hypothetical protein